MTKDQRSLLLYLESRATDHGGKVATVHMNTEDMAITQQWSKEGLIEFRRIPFYEIIDDGRHKTCTHFVTLSDEAWRAAHAERRATRGCGG